MMKKALLGFVFIVLLAFIGIEVYFASYRVSDSTRADALRSGALKRVAERDKLADDNASNGFSDLRPTLEKNTPNEMLKPYRAFNDLSFASTGQNSKDILVVYPARKAEIQAAAESFETILPTVRTALAKPNFLWPSQWEKGPLAVVPNFIQMRSLAINLIGYAEYLEVTGHLDQALNAYLWDVEFGGKIEQNNGLLSLMIGVAIQAIALDAMLDFFGRHPALSAADYKKAIERLDAIPTSQKILLDRTDEEYAGQLNFIDMLVEKPELFNQNSNAPVSAAVVLILKFPGFMAREKRVTTNVYLVQREGLEKHTAVSIADKLPSLSFLSAIMIPDYSRADAQVAVLLTKLAAARVECALELYRLEKGGYPDSLAALAPTWLKAAPKSEVSPDGQFTYAKTDKGYTLSSRVEPYFQARAGGMTWWEFMPRPVRKN